MSLDDINEQLSAAGIRPTLSRTYILELLQDGHARTPDKIIHSIVMKGLGVSIATTYRALSELEKKGILKKQRLNGQPSLYYLPGASPDVQFVCTHCGGITRLPQNELSKALRSFVQAHGLELEQYDVSLQGKCSNCDG